MSDLDACLDERRAFWQRALRTADRHLRDRPDPDPGREKTYAPASSQSLGWLLPSDGQILVDIHDHDAAVHIPIP